MEDYLLKVIMRWVPYLKVLHIVSCPHIPQVGNIITSLQSFNNLILCIHQFSILRKVRIKCNWILFWACCLWHLLQKQKYWGWAREPNLLTWHHWCDHGMSATLCLTPHPTVWWWHHPSRPTPGYLSQETGNMTCSWCGCRLSSCGPGCPPPWWVGTLSACCPVHHRPQLSHWESRRTPSPRWWAVSRHALCWWWKRPKVTV